MRYPQYPDNITQLEESQLEIWRRERLFEQTLAATRDGQEFVFYEGPPTANGKPGIHHVISRTIKDLVARYWTMKGRHVTRIAGWDTHGLPVEIEAEKKLGISGKREIEQLGIARFNEVCRESVFTYKEDWERFSERIGYWLDYSSPYITFSPRYIESVWWILQRLNDQGLIYRGYKSVPYCPRCGTALSSHEVAQGYEDVRDPSLYFLCPWQDDASRAFLVWTTTPWTLPSNVALAIHPDLVYAEVEHNGRLLILAETRVNAVFGETANVVRRHRAADLIGTRYVRPFDIVKTPASETAWRVYAEDFVSADDGTGLVHLAPAFGADDYAAGQRHQLPLVRPIDDAGKFQEDVALVPGLFVKAADEVLVADLSRRGLVCRHSLEWHSYPHCWRCASPLIYMARDSWYIRTTARRDLMIHNNAQVSWYPPEVGTGRFGEWLAGNVDWALSRERYWGTPLPAWICSQDNTHIDFIGSLAELGERAGGLPADFDPHRPFIDEQTWSCRQCAGTMRRTPEVIDVWFDSGAMPYAQWHYPFENQAQFKKHYPADFICEAVDQTRGWFYSLMAISTMLGDGPSYRHVLVNDMILDKEGQKMSKSRGNVVDPWEMIAAHGADAIRWYLLTVSQPWMPKQFDPDALAEHAHRTFDTLANTYKFFEMYANLERWSPGEGDPPVEQRGVLDRWIVARTAALVAQVRSDLDSYEITRAARALGEFIVDDLSNWFVRRSRDRFYGSTDEADTRAAFRTLWDVLQTVARLLAPITPFQSDWLYRALTGQSVHLAGFPEAAARLDLPLLEGMSAVRMLSRLGRAARTSVGIRVRQPLRTLYAVVPSASTITDALLEVVRDELNVKDVRFLQAAEELVTLTAVPNFRIIGKRFGAQTQQAAQRIRELTSAQLSAFRAGAPLIIKLDGQALTLSAEELEIRQNARGELVVESDEGFTVALDPTLDEALKLEGLARELVNRVQRARRDSGLEVSDRIRLGIFSDSAEVIQAAERFRTYIAGETLTVALETGTDVPNEPGYSVVQAVELEGLSARLALQVTAKE
ncbi:MAG: isoleucine--tRNA ligase [Longimicrobiales bacterium]